MFPRRAFASLMPGLLDRRISTQLTHEACDFAFQHTYLEMKLIEDKVSDFFSSVFAFGLASISSPNVSFARPPSFFTEPGRLAPTASRALEYMYSLW